jgi:Cof subfamily protein (haloacid dehalogenase superfamily)
MLVLDMDGTLLNEHQIITKENTEAISRIMDMGIKVVIATGRPYQGIIPYLKELGLYQKGIYSITCSGALVIENVTENILYEEHIKNEELSKIQKMCESLDIDMSGYTKNHILIHHENLFSRYDALANNIPLKQVDFHKLSPEIKVFKLNIINEGDSDKEDMINYFPSLQLDHHYIREKANYNPNLLDNLGHFPADIMEKFTIVRPLPFCLELLDAHSNKAVGVNRVAKEYDVLMEEIICIGDSGNDVHMLLEAGLGIAMANASEEAKRAADEVTLSNENSGVAAAIHKYFLTE